MKLDEVCEFIVDCPHTTAKDEGEGYPLIRTPNIGRGRLNLEGVHRVSEEVYQKRIKRGTPQAGDLILAREAPAGNVAVIQEGQKVCLGQRTVLIRPDKCKVDSDYLAYYLLAPEQQCNLLGTANGATVPHVNMPMIRGLKIELPTLEEQKRLGKMMANYDDLIANHQQQIKLLEEAAQRLYKEWFVDLRFPGCEKAEIVDGVLKGWKYEPLNDVAEVVMGQSPKSDYYNQDGEGLPFHQGVASYGNRYVSNTVYASQYNRVAPEGSILFSVRAPVGRLNITKYKIAIGRGLAAINAKNGKRSFLWYCLKNKFFKDDIIGNGSIFSSITKNDLLAQKLLMPEINILSKFDEIAGNIDDKIEVLDRQLVLLQEARDRLLPKLISGEIEVSS